MAGARGIALSTSEVVLLGADGRAARRALTEATADATAWPALEAALLAWGETPARGALAIALMPPLAEVRAIHLPPLGDDDVHQLLARSGSKYFVGARGSQVIGVASRSRNVEQPRVAVAASARLVAAIESTVHAAGWAGAVLVPAEAAWAAAAGAMWPVRAGKVVGLVVAEADRTVVIESEGGVLRGVRRFRTAERDAALLVEALQPLDTVAVIGHDTPRAHTVRALSSLGLSLQPIPEAWLTLTNDPAALAARMASEVAAPRLASAQQRDSQAARVRRLALQLAVAASVLLLFAAGFELIGARRQLAAIEAARLELRPAVQATLVGRSSMEEAYRRVAELVTAERTAPAWSGVLADFAARVPEDAHLTGFRARGDSLVVDGLAGSASLVFQALEESPALANLRASAPVRRQAPEGSDPMERFTISAVRRGVGGVSR
jgi:hypothetical protein